MIFIGILGMILCLGIWEAVKQNKNLHNELDYKNEELQRCSNCKRLLAVKKNLASFFCPYCFSKTEK